MRNDLRQTKIRNAGAALLLAAAAMLLPSAHGQSSVPGGKPSPYAGVSQPPPDDTIVASPDTPAAPARPAATAPAVPQTVAQPAPTAPAPAANPDADIVTSVPVAEATPPPAPATSATGAALQPRYNPDADIVTYVPGPSNQLPEGTPIEIRLAQEISNDQTRRGSAFSGHVVKDVTFDGRVVIPEGSELRGHVTQVTEGSHIGSPATIRLRPEEVVLPDGSRYDVHAQVVATQGHRSRVDSEGGIQPGSKLKKNTIAEGIGAGTGAIVGAKIAGGPGALVGSLVGVGVVTTHLLMQHPQKVNVPNESTITLNLTAPLSLTPVQN